MKLKDAYSLEENLWPTYYIKKGRHCFANKGPFSQSYSFSSSHIQTGELDHKNSWAPKNWCSRTVVLEKTSESPLDRRKIKQVNPKGNQPSIFIGKTDAEAPVLWPPDGKNHLTGTDPDAGKDWGQEDEKATEDKMVGWHHKLNRREYEPTPGDSGWQRSLAGCSPRGCEESGTAYWLNHHHKQITPLQASMYTELQCCAVSDCKEKESGALHTH